MAKKWLMFQIVRYTLFHAAIDDRQVQKELHSKEEVRHLLLQCQMINITSWTIYISKARLYARL